MISFFLVTQYLVRVYFLIYFNISLRATKSYRNDHVSVTNERYLIGIEFDEETENKRSFDWKKL